MPNKFVKSNTLQNDMIFSFAGEFLCRKACVYRNLNNISKLNNPKMEYETNGVKQTSHF